MNTEDAIRRGEPGKYRRLSLPILSSTPLPAAHPATCTFAAALNRRVSGDVFSSPTNQELSDFLNDVFGIRFIDGNDRNRQKRSVASMGAFIPRIVCCTAGIMVGAYTFRRNTRLACSPSMRQTQTNYSN